MRARLSGSPRSLTNVTSSSRASAMRAGLSAGEGRAGLAILGALGGSGCMGTQVRRTLVLRARTGPGEGGTAHSARPGADPVTRIKLYVPSVPLNASRGRAVHIYRGAT